MKAAYATYVHMCTLHDSWCNLWIEYRPRMGHQQNRRYSLVDEYEGCWAKHKSKTTNWKVDANWKRTSVKHIEHHITIELNLNELKHSVFKNIKCSQSSSAGHKKPHKWCAPLWSQERNLAAPPFPRLGPTWDPSNPQKWSRGGSKGPQGLLPTDIQNYQHIAEYLSNVWFWEGCCRPGCPTIWEPAATHRSASPR